MGNVLLAGITKSTVLAQDRSLVQWLLSLLALWMARLKNHRKEHLTKVKKKNPTDSAPPHWSPELVCRAIDWYKSVHFLLVPDWTTIGKKKLFFPFNLPLRERNWPVEKKKNKETKSRRPEFATGTGVNSSRVGWALINSSVVLFRAK